MASSWYDVPPALRDVDPAYVAGGSFSTEISEAHLSTGVRFTSIVLQNYFRAHNAKY